MATNLKKMVEEWWKAKWGQQPPAKLLPTHRLFLAMAEQIEANTKNINETSKICQNLALTCEILSERIDLLRKELPESGEKDSER